MDYIDLIKQAILLVIGFVMLIKGADWFVESASKVAEKLGISQLIIGLTIVAMGTSAPEAAISITSAIKGSAGITIGNVLGSNIMNILLILGITAVIIPVAVAKSTLRYEIPFVIVVSGVLLWMGRRNSDISRLDAFVLIMLFVLFLVYLFYMGKKGTTPSKEETKKESQPASKECKQTDSIIKLVIMILIGGGLIVWGSDVTVNSATAIAIAFNMSPRLIGLTIVAFGTSLPELITSVTAAIKGKADIAIGNIVGSNIFNILLVVGVAALIKPVEFESKFIFDGIMCIGSAVILLLCVIKSKKLTRISGFAMLAVYAGYFVYIIK